MRFKTAVKKLESLINYERKPAYDYDLNEYREFLRSINSPHERLSSVVLIAGTKGKGSTGMILSSILSKAGYKVGFFNSPHLIDVRERIRINNKKIPKARFVSYIERVLWAMQDPRGIRSYFEALVTTAILYFLDEDVDYAIFEVGMGGRKDATNVHKPALSIITRIGHDHKRFLGANLKTIAKEKAGIIHDHTPVIVARQIRGVRDLLKEIASTKGAPYYYAEDLLAVEVLNQDHKGSYLVIRSDDELFTSEFSLVGEHQIENLKAAVVAARLLGVGQRSLKQGLKDVRVPARIEIIDTQPRIIIDTAHNPQSFNALAKVLPTVISGRLFVIFGISRGKDWSVLRRRILPWSYRTIITRARLPRAKNPRSIIRTFPAQIINDVGESIALVLEQARRKDTILITGSFFVAGEAIEMLMGLGFKLQTT